MHHYLYAVIILNFNTIADSIAAAKSVIENSIKKDFVICIADNASTVKVNKDKLKSIDLMNTFTVQLDENHGYAAGNNAAIRYLKSFCDFDFVVIMNPDVMIIQTGTIEGIIDEVNSNPNSYVGGQPLTKTGGDEDIDARYQPNIRRNPSYIGIMVYSSSILKRVFKKKYGKLIYEERMPYSDKCTFDVPSGAFFLINAKDFEIIGYFDEDTFLYYEEYILGMKIKNIGKQFIFLPNFQVNHYHGKSTGGHGKIVSRKNNRYGMQALDVYLRKYLKVNSIISKLSISYLIFEYEICIFIKKVFNY